MIVRLRGELIETSANSVVVEAGGVGYEVLVPASILGRLPDVGQPVTLITRQVVRESDITLYGFHDRFQRLLFDRLVDVSGCGPKTALSILSDVGEEQIASALQNQDPKPLTRATGVGPKLAERIVVELKDKIQQDLFAHKISTQAAVRHVGVLSESVDDELVEALIGLGYRRYEAELVAPGAREAGENLEDRLRLALRSLRR